MVIAILSVFDEFLRQDDDMPTPDPGPGYVRAGEKGLDKLLVVNDLEGSMLLSASLGRQLRVHANDRQRT